jgi:hypothetical protein
MELALWSLVLGLSVFQGACDIFVPVAKYGPGPLPDEDCSRFTSSIVELLATPQTLIFGNSLVLTARVDLREPERPRSSIFEARISAPNGTSATVTLQDDGQSPDVAAGDGIYSAEVNPGEPAYLFGQYMLGTYPVEAFWNLELGWYDDDDWATCTRSATTDVELVSS